MSEEVNKIKATYNEPREEGDVDLVEEVRKILLSAGKEIDIDLYDNHEYVLEAKTKRPLVQRFILNKYWTLQILNIQNVDSIDVRFCLVNKGDVDKWLELFKTKVLTFIIAHDLPHF